MLINTQLLSNQVVDEEKSLLLIQLIMPILLDIIKKLMAGFLSKLHSAKKAESCMEKITKMRKLSKIEVK